MPPRTRTSTTKLVGHIVATLNQMDADISHIPGDLTQQRTFIQERLADIVFGTLRSWARQDRGDTSHPLALVYRQARVAMEAIAYDQRMMSQQYRPPVQQQPVFQQPPPPVQQQRSWVRTPWGQQPRRNTPVTNTPPVMPVQPDMSQAPWEPPRPEPREHWPAEWQDQPVIL